MFEDSFLFFIKRKDDGGMMSCVGVFFVYILDILFFKEVGCFNLDVLYGRKFIVFYLVVWVGRGWFFGCLG